MSVDTVTAPAVERVAWDSAVQRMDWRPGEHVTLIGPTGRGKTELTTKLLEHRRWVLFLGTKRKDDTQDRLRDMGFRTVSDADGINPQVASRIILRPPFPRNLSAAALKESHSDIFREGIMRAFHQTGWTVCADEARYICQFLGLTTEMMLLWLQGRSQKNSVICSTQRPRFVPLEAYDQATHLFLWSDSDFANVDRIADLAGFNGETVMAIMPTMTRHDVIYINNVTGDIFLTNTRWRNA